MRNFMPRYAEELLKPTESLGRLISCLYRHTRVYVGKELEHHNTGIGSGQFPFLMALYHKDGITQEDLAHLFDVDKATSARAIKKLHKAGFITRKRDAADKRMYRIFVTEKGRALEPVVKKISLKWTAHLLSGFEEEEKRYIIYLLKKMVDNISSEVTP